MTFALTAEELHFLAADQGLAFVPNLGPLPLDPEDPESLRLMLGTAERSLTARGPEASDQLRALLAPLADPEWTATAELSGTGILGARSWWPIPAGVAELTQTSPTDYELAVIDALRPGLAEFLSLGGDDDSEAAPEEADAERLDALAADPATIARATRLSRVGDGAEGVELAWIDPGDGGPVWLVVDDDDDEEQPVRIARTGRRAVLRQLTGDR